MCVSYVNYRVIQSEFVGRLQVVLCSVGLASTEYGKQDKGDQVGAEQVQVPIRMRVLVR